MSLLITIVVFAGIAWLWFRSRHHNAVQEEKTPGTYRAILSEKVTYYQKLTEVDKAKFEKRMDEFLADVHIEGVGTEITDVDRVLIASGAIIPIFGFPDWKYKNLTNIILYPDTFDQEFQFEGENRNILGMVGSGYMNGQMLLSRAALLKGFSGSAGEGNTAIHEFVHLLDKSDGDTDGIPTNFMERAYVVPWLKMMHQEMHRIAAGKSDFNPYGLTNEAEFLAVAAEYFFEKPDQLKHKHPELYEALSKVFGQDPATGTAFEIG
jgi:Mlc titration factor MtfA (ptsG expression regulator)